MNQSPTPDTPQSPVPEPVDQTTGRPSGHLPPRQPGECRRPASPQGTGKGGAISCLFKLLLFLIVAGSLVGFGAFAGVLVGFGISAGGGFDITGFGPGMTTRVWREGGSSDQVAIMHIEGMTDSDNARKIRQITKHLKNHDEIKALVIRVVSGGGPVSPSAEILHHFKELKKVRPDLKIVASFGAVAASGGYYVSMASDRIVAEPNSITGSIGVIAQAFTFQGTMEKLGVTPVTITAGKDKDIANNPFRKWTEKDIQKMKSIIVPMHEQFVDVVIEGRLKAVEKQFKYDSDRAAEHLQSLSTGQVWIAAKAREQGLIDQIGYLEDAVDLAAKLANISDPHVITIEKQANPFEQLMGVQSSVSAVNAVGDLDSEKLRRMMQEAAVPEMMYLWQR